MESILHPLATVQKSKKALRSMDREATFSKFKAQGTIIAILLKTEILYNNLMRETQLYYFPSPLSINFIEFFLLLHPFGNIFIIDKYSLLS